MKCKPDVKGNSSVRRDRLCSLDGDHEGISMGGDVEAEAIACECAVRDQASNRGLRNAMDSNICVKAPG